MEIKIKKMHPNATIPVYARDGDGCVDLHAVAKDTDDMGNAIFDTGLAVEIPPGYVGLVFPRSSIYKTMHQLRNSVGVIDSGYRGSIKMIFWGTHSSNDESGYKIGDRIGQLMIVETPKIFFKEVDDLTPSDRGTGGFGSTGV